MTTAPHKNPHQGPIVSELLQRRSAASLRSSDLDDRMHEIINQRAVLSSEVIDILSEVESARLAGALLRNRVEFSSFLVDGEATVAESSAVESELKGLSERLAAARLSLSALSREQAGLIEDLRLAAVDIALLDAALPLGVLEDEIGSLASDAVSSDFDSDSDSQVGSADSADSSAVDPLFGDDFMVPLGVVDLGQDDSAAPVTMDTYATEEDAR